MGTSVNPAGGRRAGEHLDADAVCAQCGTVNIEETLICKVCGNNLRDQRHMRLSAEAHMEGEAATGQRRLWISRGVGVLAVIVLLLVAFNVGSIQQWMISAQSAGSTTADSNWFGPRAAAFDTLAEQLRTSPPTQTAIQAATESPARVSDFAGYYAVTFATGETGIALLRPSSAAPATAGAEGAAAHPRFDFIASLPGIEVRGVAELRGNSLAAHWDSTAVHYNSDYVPASGVVLQKEDGRLEGFGQSAVGDMGFSFVAYKIPAA